MNSGVRKQVWCSTPVVSDAFAGYHLRKLQHGVQWITLCLFTTASVFLVLVQASVKHLISSIRSGQMP